MLQDDPYLVDEYSWFLYDPTRRRHLEQSHEQYIDSLINMSLRQFYEVYEAPGAKPVFLADSDDPFKFYHNRQDSFDFVKRLLLHQFNNDMEKIKVFLANMVQWFNRMGYDNNIKMNTIAIFGDVSAGKNYFFDMWVALAQNVGYIGTVNKTNRVGFQECCNRRLIMGNEVNIESCQMDNMKSLCEGSPWSVDVKFKKGQICRRTPLILISNNQLSFYDNDAFKDVRIKLVYWSYCPLLADSKMKPYPLCIFDLLNDFNINF